MEARQTPLLNRLGVKVYRARMGHRNFRLVVRENLSPDSPEWKREKRTIEYLSTPGHPGLPFIVRFLTFKGRPATLEDGHSFIPLERWMKNGMFLAGRPSASLRLPPGLVSYILIQTCDVLRYLHHRDFVSRAVHPSLLGFSQGSLRFLVMTRSRNRHSEDFTRIDLGDPSRHSSDRDLWLPPEYFFANQDGVSVQPSWDIWHVGFLGLTLLDRHLQPEAHTVKTPEAIGKYLDDRWNALTRVKGPLTGGLTDLVEILRRTTSIDPQQRPSIDELYADLLLWDRVHGYRYSEVAFMIRRISGELGGSHDDVLMRAILDDRESASPSGNGRGDGSGKEDEPAAGIFKRVTRLFGRTHYDG